MSSKMFTTKTPQLIRNCLLKNLKEQENIKELIAFNVGYPINQDSYFSNIKYVQAVAEMQNGYKKRYNLVAKVGKTDKALRESSTLVRNLYEREMHVYTNILPKFAQFEAERGIQTKFHYVPKCFGACVDLDVDLDGDFDGDLDMDHESEIIILDDLQDNYKYKNTPKDQPIGNSKLVMLLRAFGQWHAISGAMAAQRPADYETIVQKLDKPLASDIRRDGIEIYKENMKMIYENVLNFQLNDAEKQKWKALENRIPSIMERVLDNDDGFKVVIHGDIQASNFMFKNSTPAILDWQFAARNSPVYDIADLLYTCATEEDMSNLGRIFEIYHRSFTTHLKMLGIHDPSKVYSMSDLISDWNQIAEYSVMRSLTIMKNIFSNPSPDIAKNAEKGQKFSEAFTTIDIPEENKQSFSERALYIFKKASTHGVI